MPRNHAGLVGTHRLCDRIVEFIAALGELELELMRQ